MPEKRRLKLGARLLLGFSAVIIIAILVGVLGMTSVLRVNRLLDSIYSANLKPIAAIMDASLRATYQNRGAYRLIIETETEAENGVISRGKGHLAALDASLKAYEAGITTAEERSLYGKFQDLWAVYLEKYKDFEALALANRSQEANAFMAATLRPAFEEADAVITEIVDHNIGLAEAAKSDSAKLVRNITVVMLSCVALGLGVGFFLAFSLTRSITRAVGGEPEEIERVAVRIAGGDLEIRNEDGRSLTGIHGALMSMAEKLREIVGAVQGAVSQVAAGSEQISSTAQQMSQGATEQASSAEEVSASVEEMSATIRQNTDSSVATESLARKTAASAADGGVAVAQAVEAMKEIAGRIGIIDEIARQTNLLALNAAIEAARAGEAGKGFAVVASEVRKLAERSQNAAREISSLSGVTTARAGEAGDIINRIVPDIRRNAELVQEIAAASREQSSGAEQIGKAMMQLDGVIQQNASASEEMAAMAEELSSQSVQLSSVMSFFKLSNAAAPAAAPRRPPEIAHEALSERAKADSRPRLAARRMEPPRPVALAAADDGDGSFEAY